jgi:hypothetical protein
MLNFGTNNFHAMNSKQLKKKAASKLTMGAVIVFLIHRRDWSLANEARK